MRSHQAHAIHAAKQYMGQLAPKKLISDNNRHMYWVNIDGQPRQASYIATRNPVGKKGPALICSFGLIDEKTQYNFSSDN